MVALRRLVGAYAWQTLQLDPQKSVPGTTVLLLTLTRTLSAAPTFSGPRLREGCASLLIGDGSERQPLASNDRSEFVRNGHPAKENAIVLADRTIRRVTDQLSVFDHRADLPALEDGIYEAELRTDCFKARLCVEPR